jgi:type I restriction enzyme, S subunit
LSDLPAGWINAQLGQLLTLKYGKALPDRLRSGSGLPVYGSNGEVGLHDIPLTRGETIVVGRKGSVGEVHYSAGPCSPIDTTYYVDEFGGLPARYWMYQLRNLRLRDLNKSTAIPGLNREDAYKLPISLPPRAEQKRIVDKLDSVLSKVDSCRDRLDRVPQILKKFREAVLEAAVSGRLTEEWRTNPELDGWRLGKFTEYCDIQGGTQPPKSTFISSPAPGYVRLLQIRDFGTKPVPTYIPDRPGLKKCTSIEILLGRYGASVGRVCTGMSGAYNVALAKVVPLEPIVNRYLFVLLSSPRFYSAITGFQRSAQDGFNKSDLARIDVSIPPKHEQIEIGHRVDKLFALSESLQRRYDDAVLSITKLTPSLLAKAFRGELVPQDPNEEPAGEMLERIRREHPDSRHTLSKNGIQMALNIKRARRA